MEYEEQPQEFTYLKIYSINYTLKIQRCIGTIDFNGIEEFIFDDTTTFRELHNGLEVITPAGYSLGELMLDNKQVDLNQNIKSFIHNLENTILYAYYQ